MADSKNTLRYFLYSAEQFKMRSELEKKLGKTYMAGMVIVNGERKLFTELSTVPSSRFSDFKIITSGDPSKLTYKMPYSV